MSESTAEVSTTIDAPPEAVYRLVSDLPRMGEWSPECVRCEWLDGAKEAAPGAQFKGYNRRGVRRWSTKNEVVVAEPGREIAWDTKSVFNLPAARWRYRIEPAPGGGSKVTESTEDRRGGLIKILGLLATGVSDRKAHNTEGMKATLERIKAEAEAAAR